MKTLCVALLFLVQFSGVRSQAPGEACSSGTCTNPAVCDSDNTCKNAIGADCTAGASAYCPVNAVCQGTAGSSSGTSCECTGSFEADGVYCKVKAGYLGGTCGADTECTAQDANSECSINVCACKTGFNANAFVCEADPGMTCDTGATPAINCVAGHTCDAGKCKANAGIACNPGASTPVYCLTGYTCDTTCKADPGMTCDTGATPAIKCVAGYTCDVGKCKANGGIACDSAATIPVNCLTGYTCDSTCKAQKDQACNTAASPLINCITGLACTSSFCKIPAGKVGGTCTADNAASCSDANAECPSSGTAVCTCKSPYVASSEYTCAAPTGKVGGSCTAGNDASCNDANAGCTGTGTAAVCTCKTGFETKSDLTCVVATGADCSGTKSTLCKTTDACDSNVCRVKQGQSCAGNTLNCVSGATCIASGAASTCTCDTTVSTVNSVTNLCTPKANKIGGSCTPDTCEDKNSACAAGTCTCNSGYVADAADLTCGRAAGGDCSTDSTLCVSGTSCQSGKCKLEVTQYCTLTGTSDVCVANSECTSGKCTCKTGYTAKDGLCSSAAALVISSLLMMLAFMTSRLL